MGGTLGLRTVEHAARALGMTEAEAARLAERGELRTLPVAGGGWVTTDADLAAYLRRQRGDALPPRRSRPTRTRRDAASAVQPATLGSSSVTPTPVSSVPTTATAAAPVPAPPRRRSVPIDVRPDVEPNERLDMHAAAARLGIDHREAVRLAERGRLRATRLGREWVTTARDILAYTSSRHSPRGRTGASEVAAA